MTTKRSSNIELFRVVCMIFILMCHFTIFSGIKDSLTANKVILLYSYWGGAAGNAGFMIISAYFLDRFSFSIEKVLRLFSKTTIYNIMWLIIAIALFHYDLDSVQILQSLLPTFYGGHEYAQVYILMCFLSPFLNRVLNQVDPERLKKFVIVSAVLFMFIPYLLPDSSNYMNLFTEFLFVYVFIYYLKHYQKERIGDKRFLWKSLLISVGCMVGFSVFCLVGRKFLPILTNYSSYWAKVGSIFMVVAMASLFFLFWQWEMPEVQWINKLAGTTFGVYILHTPCATRTRMYIDFLHTDRWAMSYSFVIKFALWVVVVFGVCAIVDIVCSKIFEMVEKKLLKNVLLSQRCKINDWMNT